ncbi:hypothetical protein AC20117_05160 [Arthrobacter crystallopoietes]|nr:hypothetical protein AC20117_05160 [Arthrobacter crystallopoietes]
MGVGIKPIIETYCENGIWKSRRQDSQQIFASGGTRDQAIALGRAAARNTGAEHIVMDAEGRISERRSLPSRRAHGAAGAEPALSAG